MNLEQENVLQSELERLRSEVPPMPEDFHARWTSAIKEEICMESNSKRKLGWSRRWTRFASVAAAMVFVIGGTHLTRDFLRERISTQQLADSNGQSGYYMEVAENETPAASYKTTMARDVDGMAMSMMTRGGTADSGAVQESKIIRTASLTIATKTYSESLTALKTLCEESGGWISWSSETESASGLRRASVTMRIPTEKLDAFLQGSGSIGRVTGKTETMDDVTDSYYDTAARLETQKALMSRLQALVTDAADLSDVLALEAQMADTQYQIDRLSGNLQSTDQQVNYATVDVSLREESISDDLTNQEVTLAQRIASALNTGWATFVSYLGDMAVFVTAALPFIAVVAVAGVVVRIVKSARKRKGQ